CFCVLFFFYFFFFFFDFLLFFYFFFFFFNDTATTEIYTLSLHDALPIFWLRTTASAGTSSVPTRATTGPNSRTSALSQMTSVDESSVPSISVRPENPGAEGTTASHTRWAAGRKVRGRRMPSGATSAGGAGAGAATAAGVEEGGRWAAGRSEAQAASVSRTTREAGRRSMKAGHSRTA